MFFTRDFNKSIVGDFLTDEMCDGNCQSCHGCDDETIEICTDPTCNCHVTFARMYDDVKLPSKREEDGAYDIYARFDDGVDEVWIESGEVYKMKTGLKSAFSQEFRFRLQERGSTGMVNLGINAGLIDSGFRGEWIVLLANDNKDKSICISKNYDATTIGNNTIYYPYSKAICQANLETVPLVDVYEISEEALMKIPSNRGSGMLGSSGK